MTTTETHNHSIPDLSVTDRAHVLGTFGVRVTRAIPQYPERVEVTTGQGAESVTVALTALPCGCFALIHPTHAQSLRAEDVARLADLFQLEQSGEQARAELEQLRNAAAQGESVSRAELAAALELVELADRADAEASAEASELNASIQAEILENLAGDYRQQLTDSAGQVQAAQDAAFSAFMGLLHAAETHERLALSAGSELEAAGAGNVIGRGKGTSRRLNLQGVIVDWWPPQSWAAGLLAAVSKQHQLIGRTRFDRSELPRVLPSDHGHGRAPNQTSQHGAVPSLPCWGLNVQPGLLPFSGWIASGEQRWQGGCVGSGAAQPPPLPRTDQIWTPQHFAPSQRGPVTPSH